MNVCCVCALCVSVFSISVVYKFAVRCSVSAFFSLVRVWRLNVYAAFFSFYPRSSFASSTSVFSLFLIVYFSHLLSTLYLSSIGHDIEFSSIFNDFIRRTASNQLSHKHTRTQSTIENLRYFRLAAIFQSAVASSKWMAPFNGGVVVCCCCVFADLVWIYYCIERWSVNDRTRLKANKSKCILSHFRLNSIMG